MVMEESSIWLLSTAIEVGGKTAVSTKLAQFNQSKRSALLLGSRIRRAAVLEKNEPNHRPMAVSKNRVCEVMLCVQETSSETS